MRLSAAEERQFAEEGFLIVRNAVEPGMLEPLRLAADRAATLARQGGWGEGTRTGPGGSGRWGMSNLHHPALREPVFAEYMASPPVLDVVTQLLGVEDSALEMRMCSLLFTPDEPWTLGCTRMHSPSLETNRLPLVTAAGRAPRLAGRRFPHLAPGAGGRAAAAGALVVGGTAVELRLVGRLLLRDR